MDRNKYPPGWDAATVQSIIAYYDQQTDEEVAAEIEAADAQAHASPTHDSTTAAIYRQVINDGIQDLAPATLEEIADFIYFVRRRLGNRAAETDELNQALQRAALEQASQE
jgi:hypothetical protein